MHATVKKLNLQKYLNEAKIYKTVKKVKKEDFSLLT